MTIRTGEQVFIAKPNVIVIDTEKLAPFEIGARMDALLCYSTWSPERQQKIADGICADMMAYWVELEPSREAELYGLRPQYRKAVSRASLERLHHRREEVLKAGAVFLRLIKGEALGPTPEAGTELSLADMARYLWPPRGTDYEEDYASRLHDKQKFLRGLRPIAHLAAAYEYMARLGSGAEKAASLDYQDLDFHREVVIRSKFYGAAFRAMPAWIKISRSLIDISWVERLPTILLP